MFGHVTAREGIGREGHNSNIVSQERQIIGSGGIVMDLIAGCAPQPLPYTLTHSHTPLCTDHRFTPSRLYHDTKYGPFLIP